VEVLLEPSNLVDRVGVADELLEAFGFLFGVNLLSARVLLSLAVHIPRDGQALRLDGCDLLGEIGGFVEGTKEGLGEVAIGVFNFCVVEETDGGDAEDNVGSVVLERLVAFIRNNYRP
jgi:hypothetical protein